MKTYNDYIKELQNLKNDIVDEVDGYNMRCDRARDKKSDSYIFYQRSFKIFSDIIESTTLTFDEIFNLLQTEYFFWHLNHPGVGGQPRWLSGFDVLRNKKGFIKSFLSLLNNNKDFSKKIPERMCAYIYHYIVTNENPDNNINIFFDYLEKLPLKDCIEVMKINTEIKTESCKDRVSVFLTKLWMDGAEITEITAIYKAWFSEEDFFKQLTNNITLGPWTRKQCEKVLDHSPELVTYLVNLPESTEKLKIMDACLEKYTTKNYGIFSYSSNSRKKLLACKDNILTDQVSPVAEAVEVHFQAEIDCNVNNTIVANEVMPNDNPYIDYALLNKTKNVLSIFTQFQEKNSSFVRVEIPETIRIHIEKTIDEYRVSSTFSQRIYAQRRNKQADFLEQLMEHIQRYPSYSYKQCIEAFKQLRGSDFNGSITGDSTEEGNVQRILSMLSALDNECAPIPSAPPMNDASLRVT